MICVLTLALLSITASATQEVREFAAFKNGSYVDVQGVIRTGVAVFGGGMNGIIVETEDRNWELDFGDDLRLKDMANSLDGKPVVATGLATVREGSSSGTRYVLEVTQLGTARRIALTQRQGRRPREPFEVSYAPPERIIAPPRAAPLDAGDDAAQIVEAEPLGRPVEENFIGREPRRWAVPRGTVPDYWANEPLPWWNERNALDLPFRGGDDRRGVITPKIRINW
jgi:hypothetical protein